MTTVIGKPYVENTDKEIVKNDLSFCFLNYRSKNENQFRQTFMGQQRDDSFIISKKQDIIKNRTLSSSSKGNIKSNKLLHQNLKDIQLETLIQTCQTNCNICNFKFGIFSLTVLCFQCEKLVCASHATRQRKDLISNKHKKVCDDCIKNHLVKSIQLQFKQQKQQLDIKEKNYQTLSDKINVKLEIQQQKFDNLIKEKEIQTHSQQEQILQAINRMKETDENSQKLDSMICDLRSKLLNYETYIESSKKKIVKLNYNIEVQKKDNMIIMEKCKAIADDIKQCEEYIYQMETQMINHKLNSYEKLISNHSELKAYNTPSFHNTIIKQKLRESQNQPQQNICANNLCRKDSCTIY